MAAAGANRAVSPVSPEGSTGKKTHFQGSSCVSAAVARTPLLPCEPPQRLLRGLMAWWLPPRSKDPKTSMEAPGFWWPVSEVLWTLLPTGQSGSSRRGVTKVEGPGAEGHWSRLATLPVSLPWGFTGVGPHNQPGRAVPKTPAPAVVSLGRLLWPPLPHLQNLER